MKTVTLATFTDNVQAHMLQDSLKVQGIKSMLQGELTNQVFSPLYNLGIQVLVFEEDLPRAQAILQEMFPTTI